MDHFRLALFVQRMEHLGGDLRIEHVAADGTVTVLAAKVPTLPGEIVDGTFMSVAKLRDFYAAQIEAAKADGLLLSLHLKATMMKVSDPVMFGHGVSVFYAPVLEKYADVLAELGFNPNLGMGDLEARVATLPEDTQAAIKADLADLYAVRPAIAMVNSDKGITNLHFSNDTIIDASMPVVVRDSGQMWNWDGQLQPTLAMVPDRCYGPMYAEVFDNCRTHGALDPATMGSVPNVGLMAQKAEEYGSHPTTFILPAAGTVRVVGPDGAVLMSHECGAGDIWRMSRVRDIPIQDWVKLAVTRARITGAPACFYLDSGRAHDRNVIAKVEQYLAEHDLTGIEYRILAPVEAIRWCLERIREGKDTISVTGNVLRDYNTDLFPILELGTSAKMLSVVPLMNGGGLFETGAGGSAPKHVQQLVEENYLRWDSLGEFLALAESFRHEANKGNARAGILADTLDKATEKLLDENKSPARRVGQIDNRGSHFWIANYWAQELAGQHDDAELAAAFADVAAALKDNAEAIDAELISVQGSPADIGGYYRPEDAKASAVMRPSSRFNEILAQLG